jgi:hypothetical protein
MTKLKSTLTPAHLADLRRSGLSDETIAACGFYSEDHPLKLSGILQRRYPKSRGGALVLPFRDHNGELNGFKRVKPDNPQGSSTIRRSSESRAEPRPHFRTVSAANKVRDETFDSLSGLRSP